MDGYFEALPVLAFIGGREVEPFDAADTLSMRGPVQQLHRGASTSVRLLHPLVLAL